MTTETLLELIDLHPRVADLKADCLSGLRSTPKTLPSMFLYDKKGSELFDTITTLPEYYPTRTEMSILQEQSDSIAESVGSGALVIEIGSGSSTKTETLLSALDEPAGYIPVDISKQHLLEAAQRISDDYPDLPVQPVCADYMTKWELPEWDREVRQRVAFFPGSTIGNMYPHEAQALLNNIARLLGPGGQLLIGIDLRKDPAIIVPAYDDAQGVTKAFTLNLLERLNKEAHANFDPDAFDFTVLWNDEESRIEIGVTSRHDQTLTFAGELITLAKGEMIRTECSYKYTPQHFARIASSWQPKAAWSDPHSLYSFQDLEVSPT
ncbi:MAG: L-histidine N(alpha)-methyltransferase [Phycisphaeraceae bacterium]